VASGGYSTETGAQHRAVRYESAGTCRGKTVLYTLLVCVELNSGSLWIVTVALCGLTECEIYIRFNDRL